MRGATSLSPSRAVSSLWGAALTAGTLSVPWLWGAEGLLCREDPTEACTPQAASLE